MTINEQVAEVLGWECINDVLFDGGSRYPQVSLGDAKILQDKMVQDWWEIELSINSDGIMAAAARMTHDGSLEIINNPGWHSEESAAIFDLFCRVYGIKEEV